MVPDSANNLASDSLLATKLAIPPTRSELVGRPRLLDALNAGLSRKLTLVSAPAGFGKTTLLSTWASVRDSPVGWLTLDEEDNDPGRFLTYCVAAMKTCYSDVGESVLVRLQAQPPPALDSLMTALINDLFRLPGRLALVLDDYHAIGRQEIHAIVTHLLEQPPPQLRLLMTTRSDPPLPLARLRGRRELSELRAADLRFTRAEAVAFLARGMGVALSDAALATLEARIEGWAVGLQLAGLALKGQAEPALSLTIFAAATGTSSTT